MSCLLRETLKQLATLLVSCAGAVMCRSGTNNSAMFAEIVPEQLRSAVYAFDRSFEGAVGATAAPLVGLVAEKVFGYHGSLGGSVAPAPALVLANAQALGNSMLILLLVPWGLDLLFYTVSPSTHACAHLSLSHHHRLKTPPASDCLRCIQCPP